MLSDLNGGSVSMLSDLNNGSASLSTMIPFYDGQCGKEIFSMVGSKVVVNSEGIKQELKLDPDINADINDINADINDIKHDFRWLEYDESINMLITIDPSDSIMGIIDSVGRTSLIPFPAPKNMLFKEAGADAYFDENKCMTVVLNGMYTDEGKLIIQKTYLDWTQGAPFRQKTIKIEKNGVKHFSVKDFVRNKDGSYVFIGTIHHDLYLVLGKSKSGVIQLGKAFSIDTRFSDNGSKVSIGRVLDEEEEMFVISVNDHELLFSENDISNGSKLLNFQTKRNIFKYGTVGNSSICNIKASTMVSMCKGDKKSPQVISANDPKVRWAIKRALWDDIQDSPHHYNQSLPKQEVDVRDRDYRIRQRKNVRPIQILKKKVAEIEFVDTQNTTDSEVEGNGSITNNMYIVEDENVVPVSKVETATEEQSVLKEQDLLKEQSVHRKRSKNRKPRTKINSSKSHRRGKLNRSKSSGVDSRNNLRHKSRTNGTVSTNVSCD